MTRRFRSKPEPVDEVGEAGVIQASVLRSLGGPADGGVRDELADLRRLRDSGALTGQEYALRLAARLGKFQG